MTTHKPEQPTVKGHVPRITAPYSGGCIIIDSGDYTMHIGLSRDWTADSRQIQVFPDEAAARAFIEKFADKPPTDTASNEAPPGHYRVDYTGCPPIYVPILPAPQHAGRLAETRDDSQLPVESQDALPGAAPAAKERLTETLNGKTPWEFACGWYTPDEVQRCIADENKPGFGGIFKTPRDVDSREFAEWMARQYRLAMRKGIEIGQRSVAQPPKSEPEGERDLPTERSDFETFKEFTDDDSPIQPNMQKYYRRAAKQIGNLFCWCVENMQPFPPTKGDWLDVVKQRLQASPADRQELERLRERYEFLKRCDDAQYDGAKCARHGGTIEDCPYGPMKPRPYSDPNLMGCWQRGFDAVSIPKERNELRQQVTELTERESANRKHEDWFYSECLYALAGAVCTPEEGFAKSGGLGSVLQCVRDLRAEYNELTERLAASTIESAEAYRQRSRDESKPWPERFFSLENAYNHATNAAYANKVHWKRCDDEVTARGNRIKELEERLAAAEKWGEGRNQVADAMTEYMPDAARELAMAARVKALESENADLQVLLKQHHLWRLKIGRVRLVLASTSASFPQDVQTQTIDLAADYRASELYVSTEQRLGAQDPVSTARVLSERISVGPLTNDQEGT